MGYIIELSIVIKKLTNFTQKKHLLLDNAKKNNYIDYNEFSEYINKKYKYILTFEFNDEKDILNFIIFVKNTPKIYIESIFMDKTNTLIYASTHYIKIMQPEKAKEYINKKKSCELYNTAPNIIKLL
tara:strand:- start:4361 stop:4741 length:381 start_codon:yes stop_codon:yes gene_type:complete